MKVVVTGAGGFLGKEIVRQVSQVDDAELFAVSTRPESIMAQNSTTVLSADEYVAGCREVCDCQVLINCAFPRNEDPRSMALGLDYVEKVARSVSTYGFSRVINISSQSVYSQFRDYDAIESSPIVLESKYAVAKYLVEKMFDIATEDIGVERTHVRLASLIGPSFDQRLPNKLAKKMIAGEAVEISNSGQRYGYMDVRDAASGIIALAISSNVDLKPVYNLGSGESISITEVAVAVKAALYNAAAIDAELTIKDVSSVESSNSSVDSELFFSDFEWSPSFTIVDSINDIVRYAWSRHQAAGQ